MIVGTGPGFWRCFGIVRKLRDMFWKFVCWIWCGRYAQCAISGIDVFGRMGFLVSCALHLGFGRIGLFGSGKIVMRFHEENGIVSDSGGGLGGFFNPVG